MAGTGPLTMERRVAHMTLLEINIQNHQLQLELTLEALDNDMKRRGIPVRTKPKDYQTATPSSRRVE